MKWDYHDAFEGMTSNDIQELTREEVEKRKSEAMEKNAWTTAEQVRLRIDDEKGPAGDFLKVYLTEPLGMLCWSILLYPINYRSIYYNA